MKLYIYDHCPYCTRARIALAHYRHHFDTVFFANDDEAAPTALIGVKQVPILQKPDGTHMGESLDIARFAAAHAGETLDETVRADIQAWFERVQPLANRLCMPRCIKLGLPEFANVSAVAYYTEKKEAFIGTFAGHLAATPDYLAQLHGELAILDGLIRSADCLNGRAFGMEDVLVFPLLRNLTMVRGAVLPPAVSAYTEQLARSHGVDLYADRAV
ncbi:glutaredoxin 2 [Conchiformibius kuhniae]|uniref:Glutaredoxin 2 n=1 Tax=Conchiformibius kuhniae TaxID=211502 RepID=A0A8T9MUM2_9NEIS|nr:glutaredoxin 2 [Conchiformibius kuhniae]UOP05570.1 glutaredoxin 2 [Conchiformibius kuhniae]